MSDLYPINPGPGTNLWHVICGLALFFVIAYVLVAVVGAVVGAVL